MTSIFRKAEEWFTFFDGEGNKIERKTEVRFDPLTGESSRLVFDPGMTFTPPDYTELAKQTSGEKCPFCPENILKLTPVFPKEMTKKGRFFQGEAILFPNLFPYSKHNGVVAISKQHYVQLQQFTIPMMKDAFLACQSYIEQVMKADPQALYASINWNYLPLSGGSIIHPHMHVVVSETPTNYQDQLEKQGQQFLNKYKQDYFSYLVKFEKQSGQRWIGERGNMCWLHAYAPKSHNDFFAIFPNKTSITDMNEQDWLDFATGLQAIFATLSEQGFASFNLALSISNENAQMPIHARIIPRLTIGTLGTSDMNFFQVLHQEPLTYKVPEEVANLARQHFIHL